MIRVESSVVRVQRGGGASRLQVRTSHRHGDAEEVTRDRGEKKE
jgi:hypothetical protein